MDWVDCEWKDKEKKIIRLYLDLSEELALKILLVEKERIMDLLYDEMIKKLKSFLEEDE